MADLANRIAVIAGAADVLRSGIGEGLAEAGATVRVTGDEEEALSALLDRVRDEHGRLDVVVTLGAHAADPPAGEPFRARLPALSGRRHMEGLCRAYTAAALAAPLMVAEGGGLLVHVAPAGGGGTGRVARAVAAAGIDRMAREMARELAPYDVAVLSLQPASPPRFTGRCIAALAMDPDIMEKSGGAFRVDVLVEEYRFAAPGETSSSG